MGRWTRWLDRQRRDGLVLPPTWSKLWIGLAIAVIGPAVITPLVQNDPLSVFPGVPYVFVIVAATVFGRLLAAGVAVAVSTILLDRYIVDELALASERPRSELWAILAFVVIALVVVRLLVRRDRSIAIAHREQDRMSFLARAGDAMSGTLDADEAVRALAAVIVPDLADWFSVDLVDESDGEIRNLLVVHPDPGKVELAQELQRRFPSDPDAPSGVPHVIRTGRSELTETIPDAMLRALIEDPELLETMRGLRLRCAMSVPLTARGRTLGALTLIGAETHDRYTVDDLRLAEEIGDRAALAIDTAHLFEAEDAARRAAIREADRNRVLKDVTAAFGRAGTVDEILTAMLEDGIRGAGATAGTVGTIDGDRVLLMGATGYEPDDHPYWHSFGVDEALPLADAIRERRPVVVTTTAERDAAYPALRGRGEQRDHALVCLPLLLGGDPIGGFSASYPPGTVFGPDDLTFLQSLGEQCAQAVDRARARDRAALTQARFDALASASRSLAGTLDLTGTIRTILRVTTELLGGRATLVEPVGKELLVLGATEGADLRAGEEVTDLVAPVPDAIAACLAGEGAQVVPGDEATPAAAAFPLTIAERTSAVLVVRDPTIDVTSDDEMTFAREVVRRMARALENARLYRDRDYVARTLQRSLLPAALPDVPGVEIEALFLPAVHRYEIGGDFYDVFPVGEGRWGAVVGDVCGKGVEAASLTGLARHTLRAVAEVGTPTEALGALNRALLHEPLDGRFVTVAYVLIDPDPAGGADLVVASGGHPLPQRRSRSGHVDQVGAHGTLLGVTEDPRLHDVDVRLDPGDAIVLFTDGLLAKDEPSGDEPAGLVEVLRTGGSPADIGSAIRAYVDRLIADEQSDDIVVLILRAVERP